jgi:hypothetical protein
MERINHGIPEEPARRDSTLVPPSLLTGLMKNMDASPPHEKRMHTKYKKKLYTF